MRVCYVAGFAIFSLVICSKVHAQNNDERYVERIITTTRLQDALSETAMTTSTIGESTLNLVSPVHIEEVLKFVAGMGVQRGNGMEYLPALRSQVFAGAGACGGLLTAEDGIPLRAAGFCNVNELFEAHSEMAARIDVIKGPGSALYGANAIHGVINVITPDTTQDDGFAALELGSFGFVRGKVRAGVDRGDSGIGINASITRDNGWRDAESVDQEKVNLRARSRWGKTDVTAGLTYTNLYQNTAGFIEGFERYRDRASAQQNSTPNAYRDARALRLWTRFETDLDEQRTLLITPYMRDQYMDFLMHFLPGTPFEENDQRSLGVQTLYRHDFSSDWQLSVGVDAEVTQGGLRQFQVEQTQGSAFLVETIPAGLHYDYQVDATQIAPFVSVAWQRDEWLFSAGARYEMMHYDYDNLMVDGRTREDGTPCGFGGCRYTRPSDREDRFHNLSPKLGIQYQLTDQINLYANLSRGYRAPQATELYRLQRAQQVADLDAETADNAEIGAKGVFEALRFQLALYAMNKDNFIFRDSDFFNVDSGRTRHQGVELELSYAIAEAWDLTFAGSHARHTYAYNEVLNDININGNLIDTAPRTLANVRLGWRPVDTVRVEAEWQHVGSYFTDPENLNRYEGHDIAHLRARLDVSPRLQLYLRVNNLLDTAYADRADFTGFSGPRYFPGAPRNAMATLAVQW